MIHELKIKNFLSFKHEVTLSFEATRDKKLEDQHVVELENGVRLLKLAIVYGANASGKSNLLEAFEFLRDFWFETPESKEELTKVIPFKLDDESEDLPTEFNLTFYINGKKYLYALALNEESVLSERLDFYPGVQPANVFDRKLKKSVSEITFGPKIKITQIAKDEISIKCLHNMSVFAAFQQVNVEIAEINETVHWMNSQVMPSINVGTSLLQYTEQLVAENSDLKNRILTFLKKADFNISDIHSEIIKEEISDELINKLKILNFPAKELDRIQKDRTINSVKTTFEHMIQNKDGNFVTKPLPIEMQSDGTKRIFGLGGAILTSLDRKAFLTIDEIESKQHPKLIEFVIEQFLKESDQAQLLLSTHYDGLLEEEDLLRKDNIWFTEKLADASTNLYSLTDFKGVNRITSLQKAYKYGRFGAIPNIE